MFGAAQHGRAAAAATAAEAGDWRSGRMPLPPLSPRPRGGRAGERRAGARGRARAGARARARERGRRPGAGAGAPAGPRPPVGPPCCPSYGYVVILAQGAPCAGAWIRAAGRCVTRGARQDRIGRLRDLEGPAGRWDLPGGKPGRSSGARVGVLSSPPVPRKGTGGVTRLWKGWPRFDGSRARYLLAHASG